MYRRLLLLACAVGMLLLAACTSGPPGRPMQVTPPPPPSATTRAPNFVFVLTDDLASNLVRYMPNVQAMERSGISFSHYFVVDSLCCPSRSAIFTGQYPHDDGVFTNAGKDGGYTAYNAHGDPPKSFGVALHNAGYRTGFMGKYLNGYIPQDQEPIGWDEWDVAGNGYREYGYDLNENGKLHGFGDGPADYLTDVLSTKASTFIAESAHKNRPFALEVATFAPHRPSTPAPRDANTFGSVTAPRGPTFDRKPTGAPNWLASVPALTAKDMGQIDSAFRERVRSVQAVDRMIGRLRDELRAKGLADNTYFVFSSDNGFHMGDYSLRPGKQTAFDTDIGVPLVVTGPGIAAGSTSSAMASSIDLAPTFESLAGAHPTADRDGVSLAPLLRGQSPPGWQRAVLVEHHGPAMAPDDPDRQSVESARPPSYEAMRSATALYVEYMTGEREYYDLTTDPYELHNLSATMPAAQLAALHRELRALAQCHGARECATAGAAG